MEFCKLVFIEELYEDGVGRGLAPAGHFPQENGIVEDDKSLYFPSGNPEIILISGGGSKPPPYIENRYISINCNLCNCLTTSLPGDIGEGFLLR